MERIKKGYGKDMERIWKGYGKYIERNKKKKNKGLRKEYGNIWEIIRKGKFERTRKLERMITV